MLLTGPDLNNSLLGVLLRFRKERVAILADIQQMSHCFQVHESRRNFLRFLWHQDNDLSKPVVEYRMKVHVFGNAPSPAVAIYGLRRAIDDGAQKHGADTVKFVKRHFYVDDGLLSLPSEAEAIDLLQRTQASLAESNLRLHKFVSNCQAVIDAFPPDDCVPISKEVDFDREPTFTQRSLGLLWETASDTFTYATATDIKPFTRRGVLSTVNSIFDPLGLLAPVTIQGRALLRKLTSELPDWDVPLPEDKLKDWEAWRDSLQCLQQLHVPRTYTTTSLTKAVYTELSLFSDASVKAIGAVAYLKVVLEDGKTEVGFVMGKAKLAPQSEPTIPRLELCAAVIAAEMADFIQEELDLNTCITHLLEPALTSKRFEHFSTFTSLVRGVAFLIHMTRSFKRSNQDSNCRRSHKCHLPRTTDEMDQAKEIVLKAAQRAAFVNELLALQADKPRLESSPFQKLSPSLENGLICVGGRLKESCLTPMEKNPIILPKDSHISLLLVRHYHEQVKHQGRYMTEGAVRAAGLWILSGRRLINSVLHKCITCRKLRGKLEEQYMADLPPERLKTCPPFTYVGLDVFGPWFITIKRTRGGQVENKRWAIMFSCLSSRAVHIEVIESMDASSCS